MSSSEDSDRISGFEAGIFYTILYMSIASIINILVCVLAARDTFKRLETNKKNKKKWNNLPPTTKKPSSTPMDDVNRIMDATIRTLSTKPYIRPHPVDNNSIEMHVSLNHDTTNSIEIDQPSLPRADTVETHTETIETNDHSSLNRTVTPKPLKQLSASTTISVTPPEPQAVDSITVDVASKSKSTLLIVSNSPDPETPNTPNNFTSNTFEMSTNNRMPTLDSWGFSIQFTLCPYIYMFISVLYTIYNPLCIYIYIYFIQNKVLYSAFSRLEWVVDGISTVR